MHACVPPLAAGSEVLACGGAGRQLVSLYLSSRVCARRVRPRVSLITAMLQYYMSGCAAVARTTAYYGSSHPPPPCCSWRCGEALTAFDLPTNTFT